MRIADYKLDAIEKKDNADFEYLRGEINKRIALINKFMHASKSALHDVDFGSAGSAENTRTFITDTIKFTAAAQAFSSAHTLNRMPNGFVVLSCSSTTACFTPAQAHTSAVFFVQSDTANVCATFLVL